MNTARWMKALAALSLCVVGAASAEAADSNPLAAHVRATLDRFKDVAVAVKVPVGVGVEVEVDVGVNV